MDLHKAAKQEQTHDGGVVVQYFHAYFEVLHRYAYTILRDNDEAKDAVQAVFLKLWEKREALNEEQSVKSYLYTAVYHQCLNMKRHQKIKEKYVAENDKPIYDPGNDLISKERSNQILREIENLPPQCRLIFSKSRFEGKKYAEIAAELSLSVKTVEVQIGKALRTLRQKLLGIMMIITSFFIVKF
ncbi:RNA polymerase sigma-70 factor (ECF subfamily) [Chitinophaga dinghuensis]|uniref:RNA polymerase sigma-70 factor (ECF subfamily) n=1 Tax=Chitinophaga dinghuensis TaxID=1539050 RepID=A0A327VXL8_9BACT|nr:RNA polymerase sigma-70 factor [Chitinophaga dinghuensis]RAJ80242.1 RNA polymerase sigma-70 factor (ECF subfamily) [Chitinophaga dinghuensis]